MNKKYRLQAFGAIVGAVAGFLYYKLVGCASGTCIITSHPVNSSLYGAFLFWLIAGMFRDGNVKQIEKQQETTNK